MAFPGQRFVLNLDDDDEPVPTIPSIDDTESLAPSSLIGEIQERAPAAAAPPAPKPPTGTGFPQHKRRFQRSAFKQRRANQQQEEKQEQQGQGLATGSVSDEKKSIDEENRRQLASMSDAQIQQEREELISSIDPGLLERFLRRAKIDDEPPQPEKPESTKPTKSVSFNVPEPDQPKEPSPKPQAQPEPEQPQQQPTINEDLPPPTPPSDLHPASELPPSFHFPTPPPSSTQPPPLDPSSPSFLSDLQSHYFPNTPHDTSALSWLKPDPSPEEAGVDPSTTSPYDPSSTAEAIYPAAIRFSLTGTILAPSTSLSLPTTLGLHHHGNDPQAAGYTIPELAILGRSSFPAQRCVAWQVLGRILYRLGKGEFGERGSPLVEGLWEVVEKEGAVAIMLAEADGSLQSGSGSVKSGEGAKSTAPLKGAGIGRHASATAWAVEGVWLWQKGGGGDRGVLKEGTIRPR